jgi:hypothetical protein
MENDYLSQIWRSSCPRAFFVVPFAFSPLPILVTAVGLVTGYDSRPPCDHGPMFYLRGTVHDCATRPNEPRPNSNNKED